MLISTITIPDRQRKLYGDIDELAESIRVNGLIQPVVVTDDNILVAGGRRLAACQKLGLTDIPAVKLGTLTPAQREMLELEENIRRLDLSWQERCQAISRIHRLRASDAILKGTDWGYEQTAELLGIKGRSNVWYAVMLDTYLTAKDEEIMKCATPAEALSVITSRKQREAERLLVKKVIDTPTLTPAAPQAEAPFEPSAVPGVSVICRLADSIEWLLAQADGSLDHVYSDPPYAIDMANLKQEGTGMSVVDVAHSHDVEENLELLSKLVQILPAKLKPTSFVVLWCDFVHWHKLSAALTSAGLRVQRWPLLWLKPQAMNQAADYNFTKASECAILAAGPRAVLAERRVTNYIITAPDKQNFNPTNTFWKPLELHQWIIKAIATKGSTIIDPFAGSGSIPLAAIQLGHNTIAIEKDERHYLDMRRILNV